ncbi:MAG: putative rane protein [Miltoncostaeaceae bacterium]|jgi:putative membrane protein|nr:putative rane protein [Miltoncostaeaceae bacterium]
MSDVPVVEGRLHPLAILLTAGRVVRAAGIGGVVALLSAGGSPLWFLGALAIGLAIGVPLAVLAWRRFTYRVIGDRLEIRAGVLTSSLRTIPLDRIRGVDISAPFLHRLVGLVSVRVDDATGGKRSSGLRLAAIRRGEAEDLRDAVLERRTAEPAAAAVEAESPAAAELARVSTGMLALGGASSLRFLLVPFAALAALFNLVDDLPVADRLIGAAEDRAPTDPLVLALSAAAAIAIAAAVAAIGSVLVDGGFRLSERRGRLVAERGLLDKRSVSIDRRRVRAFEVRESPIWRLIGLASVRAVVGGVPEGSGDAKGRTALLPVERRRRVWVLVRQLAPGVPEGLTPHPPAARLRRLTRAVALPAVAAIATGALGLTAPAIALAVATLLMAAVGLDRHRNLGHRLERGWLGLREGSFVRRHALIEPGSVVAYRISASPFQRRAGLCTLTAYLGQGAGSRRALDLDHADAVALLAGAEPELFGPLVERRPG